MENIKERSRYEEWKRCSKMFLMKVLDGIHTMEYFTPTRMNKLQITTICKNMDKFHKHNVE